MIIMIDIRIIMLFVSISFQITMNVFGDTCNFSGACVAEYNSTPVSLTVLIDIWCELLQGSTDGRGVDMDRTDRLTGTNAWYIGKILSYLPKDEEEQQVGQCAKFRWSGVVLPLLFDAELDNWKIELWTRTSSNFINLA